VSRYSSSLSERAAHEQTPTAEKEAAKAARRQAGFRRHQLYSLQWKHNGMPHDLHLQLVKDPAIWFEFVTARLLDALAKHDPNLRDRLSAAAV
jgi:hypothetical protein